MKNTNFKSKDLHEKFHEFYSSNYQKELSWRRFMRIANFASYLTGVLGYKLSMTKIEATSVKWNLLPLPLIISVPLFPFICINIYNELHRDIYKALATVPVCLTGAMTMVQGFRFFHKEKQISEFYTCIYKCWDKELQNGIDYEVIKNARKHIVFGKFYAVAMISALIPWLLGPFKGLFVYYVRNESETFMNSRVLPTTYPFEVDNVWKWLICNIWEAFAMVYVAIVVVAIDLRFIQACALLSLQIQMVGHKLQTVVKQNDRRENDCRLVNRLHAVAKQHCQVIKLCRRIEHIFNPVLLALMISSSIALCTCIVTMEKEVSQNNFGGAVAPLAHFSALLIQTTAYCNTAENICNWLDNIPRAMYESQWIGHSARFKKRIILIILRSQRQFKFKTYGLYDVDREQLRKIMILALNLLTMLRNIRSFKA